MLRIENIQWNPHDFISECSMTTAIHSRTQSESSYQYNCRKNTKLYKNFKYQQHYIIKSPICNVNLVCTKTSCSQTEKQQDTTIAQKATLHQIIFDRYFSAMKFNICSEVNSWYWLICTYLVVQCETFKRLK